MLEVQRPVQMLGVQRQVQMLEVQRPVEVIIPVFGFGFDDI